MQLAFALALLLAPGARAATIRVPEDRSTITAALEVAAAGDVISVAAGTYSARTGEVFPLRISNRNVTIAGEGPGRCTLDGASSSQLIVFESGDASTVSGLTLRGGRSEQAGATVLIRDASPVLSHLRFSNGRSLAAGDAIAIDGGGAAIRNCLFTGNRGSGGTIVVERGAPEIALCTFHENGGAAIVVRGGASPILRDCVISRPGWDGGPSVGIFVEAVEGAWAGPSLERNLLSDCVDDVLRVEGPSAGSILAALEGARRGDGLRVGEPLDGDLRPVGDDAVRLGAFAGLDPLTLDELGHGVTPGPEDEDDPLLGPSIPNPFRPATTIHFQVPDPTVVDLGIYNILGQRVRTLYAGEMSAGEHTRTWDGHDDLGVEAPPGIYFVRITQGRREPESRRLVLIR